MKLPIMDTLASTPTGARLPPRSDIRLGLYSEVETMVESSASAFRYIHRMEVRVGTQFAMDETFLPHLRGETEQMMRGRLAQHIYGPIHDELRKHLYDLLDEGIRGPVLDRLNEMLRTFDDAFRGRPHV